jgi:transcriptional regulator with XRE-family HTH domain
MMMIQTIYSRIEVLIASRKMTKKAFCEDVGISTGNFGDWKRGKSVPSANKLVEIAKYFDVSLDWLMTGKERSAEGLKESKEQYFFGQLGQLGCQVDDLTQQEKAFIKEYVKFTQYLRQKGKE